MLPIHGEEKIVFKADIDDQGYTAKLKQMMGNLQKAQEESIKGNTKLKNSMLATMTQAQLLGSAISFVRQTAVEAAKDFVKFQTNLAKANTLIGVSRRELEGYGLELMKISTQTGKSALDISDGWYQALSSGVKVGQSMEFMQTASHMAVAGFTSVEKSVDLLTSTLNAFSLKVKDANEVSDVFLATQNKGKIVIDELASVFYQVGPIASQAGIGIRDVGAAIAALTLNGVPAAQAAVGLRQVIVELSRDGSDAAKRFQETTGQTFSQFIASGKTMGDVLEVIKKTSDTTKKSIISLFSEVRAGNTATTLASDGGVKFAEALEYIEQQAGLTEKGLDIMTQNIGGQFQILAANLQMSFNIMMDSTNLLSQALGKLNTALSEYNTVASITARSQSELSYFWTLDGGSKAKQLAITTEATAKQEAYNEAMRRGANEAQAEAYSQDFLKDIIEATNKGLKDGLSAYDLSLQYDILKSKSIERLTETFLNGKLSIDEYNAAMAKVGYSPVDEATGLDPKDPAAVSDLPSAKVKKTKEKTAEQLQREQEAAWQKELQSQLLQSEIDFYTNLYAVKSISEETIADMESNYKLSELEQIAAFWENKVGQEDKYQKAMLDLKKASFKQNRKLEQDNLNVEKMFAKDREGIQKYSNKMQSALASALIDGKVKNLGDLVQVLGQELEAELYNKAAFHTAQALSDTALGVSYLARPSKAALAPIAFKSAAENAAAALAFGAGGAIAGGIFGGSSESSDSSVNPDSSIGGDDAEKEFVGQAGDTGQTVIVDVPDELYEILLNKLNQTSKDVYNIKLVGTKY
ncbi:MAG: phage tail tape measure protein [Lactococcus garvieae]